jgi:guanylate kinase
MSDKKEKIIVIGKGTSGKDYLTRYLESKGLKRCVTSTTRPKRTTETVGVDYNYLTNDEFTSMINEGKFQEWASFNDWHYGTTKDDFETNQVFIKTPSGINQMTKEDRERSFIVYIDISEEVRRERLSKRNDSNDSIERRLEADERDFENFDDYDMRITDPDFDPEIVYLLAE